MSGLIGRAEIDSGLEGVLHGRLPGEISGHHIYFGDIHNHSAESVEGLPQCGTGSIIDNYTWMTRYGKSKEKAVIDFSTPANLPRFLDSSGPIVCTDTEMSTIMLPVMWIQTFLF